MPRRLSDEQITSYHRNGYYLPIRVLEPARAAECLAAADELEARLGPGVRPTDMNCLHLHFPWAYDLVTAPAVLDAAEDVLGPDIVVWGVSLFSKHGDGASYVSWHQDGTYWNLDGTQLVTAWIALSPSTVENGCMRVVAGSHDLEYQKHRDTYTNENLLSRGQEVAVEVDEADAVDLVLQPGEMSLHNIRIIHGSNANCTNQKRVGFVIRYTTPQVRQLGTRPKAVLARGQCDDEHYQFVDRPQFVSMDAAIEQMRQTAAEHLKSVMR